MEKDRRHQLRVPVQMWVEESLDTARYFQHCSNLSEGGIFIEKTIPHPVGTCVDIEFTLPGEDAPIRVRAEIVSALEGDDQLGMGMKFVDLPPDAAGKIRQFIAGRAG